MEKQSFKIDDARLKELITKHTVEIFPLGLAGYAEKVINATKLLTEIHTCADCTEEVFIEYVNALSADTWMKRDKYIRIPEIDILFQNIKFVGMFREKGHENLGLDPYITYKSFQHLIKM